MRLPSVNLLLVHVVGPDGGFFGFFFYHILVIIQCRLFDETGKARTHVRSWVHFLVSLARGWREWDPSLPGEPHPETQSPA